jgi:hypothetical protein
VASPDGKTIHVLASSGQGASNLTPQYYILPLDVATVSYGQPVHLPLITPLKAPGLIAPALLATPDGSTVYCSIWDATSGVLLLYALDPAGYQITHKRTWQPSEADARWVSLLCYPACCNADGSALLIVGFAGLGVINVGDGITRAGCLDFGDSLKMFLPLPQQAVNAHATRAYFFAADRLEEPINGSMLAVDLDLTAGTLSLARNARLGQVPFVAGPCALSPDGGTLYMLTAADTLTAFDTATFAASVPYSCGRDGQFTPLLLATGTQPDVLYCTGANRYANDNVSVLTIG